MRAIVISEHGGPEVLRLVERSDPSPAAGEVLVRVGVVAVNRLDIWVRENVGHAYEASLPLIPGYDVAGEIVAVGEGVTTVAAGDRVYVHCDFSCGRCEYCLEGDEAACAQYGVLGVSRDGGYADYMVTPVRNAFSLAESLSFETAAAAGSVYLTAYHMLFSRGDLRPGETVLVTAAGSGVGGAAIALARFAGASVLATASTEAKRRRALEAGVEHAVDYTQPGWASEVRDLTGGRGVDLVIDHVGESAFPDAVKALASKGRIVICGASSGTHAELDLIDLFARQISVIGSSDGTRHELLEVLRLLGEGRIDPPAIETVLPLERAPEAQELLSMRAHYGRVLLDPQA
jgi:2-desacetyl-2-hydroxyethyl bacteriochlorophyllide A dehydrogenase